MKATLVAVLALVAAAAGFVYSGAYNVAADEPHWPIAERVRAGHYAEMCERCHLAPGVPETELRRGLYPKPPELARHRHDPREAFWIVEHGIKMTGMPAWGATHDDEALWTIVAFLQALPGMDEKRYRQLVHEAKPHTHGHPVDPGQERGQR